MITLYMSRWLLMLLVWWCADDGDGGVGVVADVVDVAGDTGDGADVNGADDVVDDDGDTDVDGVIVIVNEGDWLQGTDDGDDDDDGG